MTHIFISFNVNGIRARLHQLAAVTEKYQPLAIGLQETKVHDEQFPLAAIEELGYRPFIHGQKAHYGVALLVRNEVTLNGATYDVSVGQAQKGFPVEAPDAQRRFIGLEISVNGADPIWVYNGYFPQGEGRDHPVKFPAKEAYYKNLTEFLQSTHTPDQKVIVMGDMNVAPQDIDIGIGEQNMKRWLRTGKTSFLPEEREWYAKLMAFGLFDSWRTKYPDKDTLSWFDYRSRGFEQDPKHGLRIDQILLSHGLEDTFVDAGIDHDIRAMEKPSDHCPIWVSVDA